MDAVGGRLKDLTTKPSSVFDCKTERLGIGNWD